MLLTKQILAFRPSKMDWIFATKTFLAGMLALYVAFALNLAYPIWAIGTVFVIANPFSGMTSSKSVYRALGTLLGAVVSVLVTPLLINTPWLFTLFLAAWVGGCLYISMLDRTPRSYVFMLAGYTTVIISYNIIYNIDTASMFDMAVGRFLEIMVGVVCSAIVTTTIFPLHIGPAVASKVSKTFKDTKDLFDQILLNPSKLENYSSVLSQIARDIAEIHVMAVHLAYEKSTLQGMTKPLQEMLHQLSMLVANLVAMAERVKQLDVIDSQYRAQLQAIHDHSAAFLKDDQDIQEQTLNLLPDNFEQDFADLMAAAPAEQQVILASLKMDIRHFIQNIRAIKLIWQRIQQGDASLPESVTPLTTTYPNLHRDHGVAVRGGISAFMVVIIATGFWILSGWKAGFMMAEMAAISACILTAMDNPVPALKMFVRGNIYAGVLVFIYAYGIFPHVSSFWELALVLAPFVIYCLMMFPHPPLTGIALPALMGTIMGLNLQNSYTLDQVFFFDATIGSVLGPIISIYIIHLVRAMSPEITVQRILSLHYKAIRQALYIPYGVQFRIHLRSMLDRIGVLNTKMVQSEKLKTQINLALVETSAVIDLTRLQELMHRLDSDQAILASLEDLQQGLDDYFRAKENAQTQLIPDLHQQVMLKIGQLKNQTQQLEHAETAQRIQMSLNNIRSSLCHEPKQPKQDIELGEVAHG
ncbi:fusaric acid resistance protein [Acinetobacter sp. ANC 3903]|uniref:FUSC family protein n=1 Tax=Acinetobacter sp. ANC 3903 TaxID=1977883 RepID=UPI000A3482BA|nr:FUSC family protein [Acinetobacter sp. ANC 3903]OTG64583.1 fusaric acid resistance protein [Acinetobacter sp. ANC 3903]